jgi:hypothetical protein
LNDREAHAQDHQEPKHQHIDPSERRTSHVGQSGVKVIPGQARITDL